MKHVENQTGMRQRMREKNNATIDRDKAEKNALRAMLWGL